MAIHKVSFLGLLLLSGMILLADAKPCFRNCDLRIAYEICPRPEISEKVDLNRLCTNCCAGKKGCLYFSENGNFVCEGESDPDNPKPCPRNCDPRIAYGICSLIEKKMINPNILCTNCCAGKKGCSYFSENGNFVCKGESDYEHPKACPRNCDPRIAYGICPLIEKKMINPNILCTNCCAGKKGCNYYGAGGSFICEGESEYVSEGENDFQKIIS